MNNYKSVALKFGISQTLLKNALTHYSFYEDKNEENGNGRYIFAGMYAFKGEVAKILATYISGTGTQLQHLLGNLFSNTILHTLFDDLKLNNLVRAGDNFDIKKHKHIFIYAVFGCILMEVDDIEKIRRIIMKYFLSDVKMPENKSSKLNFRNQADMLAKQVYNKKLLLKIEEKSGIYRANIFIKDGELLFSEQSKSYRYARSKVLKSAIRVMTEMLAQPWEIDPNYQNTVKERIEKQQALRVAEIKQKQEEKLKLKLETAEKRKKVAQVREPLNRKKPTAQ